jgi:glycosyltransferase involved in cell wall biosynthesis
LLVDDNVSTFSPGGGIERVWVEVLRRLRFERTVKVVIASRTGRLDGFGDLVFRMPAHNRKTFDWWSRDLELENLASGIRPDVFSSTYYSLCPGVPNVNILHDLIPEVLGFDEESLGWLQRKLNLLGSDGLLAVSQATLNLYRERYVGAGQVLRQQSLGVDREVFFPKPEADILRLLGCMGLSRGDYIVVVGRTDGYKNGAIATELLRRGLVDYDIVFVGGGTPHRSRVEQVSNRRILRLSLSDSDLATLVSGSLCLLHPSRKEGFGLPVLEALACGTPVICADEPALREASMGLGHHIDVTSVRMLSHAVDEVSREGWQCLIRKEGPERAENYSWDKFVSSFLDLVRETVLETPRNGLAAIAQARHGQSEVLRRLGLGAPIPPQGQRGYTP